MAKNIDLLGGVYPSVPGVTLPTQGGGTATFWDIDDTTATASDVLSGKYIHKADGEKVQGSIASKSSSNMTVSGGTVTAPAGYYSSDSSKSVASGTITNNTSGGTSSGTINRGNQIKIGAGYYSADAYYTAQVNSGTKTITASGTTSVDGYANASVSAGSITNNTSGGTSSGTINRGSQIKVGAGYYNSDLYYTAQANSGTKDITDSGTTSCDGYANVSVPAYVVIVNVSATSNTSTTVQNANIKSGFYVCNTASASPTADVSWSTSNGSVTLTCANGIPAMTLFLCEQL